MRASIAWFAENHVAANLLMFFLIVTSVFTLSSIKLEIWPQTELDYINISISYPGASPSEVEEAVARRIEDSISGISGIKNIDSFSNEGSAYISVEVMKDWDVNQLLDDIKSNVDRITTLPDDAEKPVVSRAVKSSRVINAAVYGDVPETTIKYWTEQLHDELINLPSISEASISGVRSSEIHIEISEAVLQRYNLTLGTISGIVAQHSMDLPAGSIETANGEVLVRTKGRRYHADNYRDIPIITRPDGGKVTLGQLAVIRDDFVDKDLFFRFEGHPAGVIRIMRVADQSALAVADAVKEFIADKAGTLPEGMQIAFFGDKSKLLRSRMELLNKNMLYGLCLVVLMLGIFLNLRLAFWVTLGIPISFAAGLIFLPYYDVSINMISLFAFIMVLGIVVDDAIIVGENIFRYGEKGSPPLKAAVEGSLEVGRPVIFSVLTTMVAFWPLLQAGGFMGKLMRNIPIVVILVLAGSLIESLYILPAHLARSRALKSFTGPGAKKNNAAARLLNRFINGPYKRLLFTAVNWRYITLSLGMFILIVTLGLYNCGIIKLTFFPSIEGDTMEAFVTMPEGTPASRTQQVVDRLESAVREAIDAKQKELPENSPALLQYISTTLGYHFGRDNQGSNLAMVRAQLLDAEHRSVSTMELVNSWRKAAGQIADAESISFEGMLQDFGKAIEVDLSHYDSDQLLLAVENLKGKLQQFAGVSDIADSFLSGKIEMRLKLKPEADNLGITLDDLALQVRHALYGAEALRFQRDQDVVKVMVRFPENERKSIADVEQMRIRTLDGRQIPFTSIAQVDMQRGYASIKRSQRKRIVTVSANVNEKKANAEEIRQKLVADILPGLKSKYQNLSYTIEGQGRSKRESMGDIYRGFAIALLGIYALLAIPFRSFSQPLVVMAAIPFGIVGAVWGHLAMGFDLSIMSLFGIVGLTGVVVNDSLVLVHRANSFRNEGLSVLEAVQKAGAVRFRAIILTSITTFAGLTPILLERSVQARFLIPMAVSLGFGVLFGTVITLILIPCGYLILNDIHISWNKFLRFAGIGKTQVLETQSEHS